MAELMNCPNCGGLFVKTNLRDVCDKCFKEEEKKFETVYKFIRIRENRTATLNEVVEGTGVEEELIIKFIRTGRLQLAQFPNLGYPCQKCRTLIREGKLCGNCSGELKQQISSFQKEEERLRELQERDKKATYFSGKKL
ncbi:TIGR03826 family flagellar region protein [Fredinandcohnia humi]